MNRTKPLRRWSDLSKIQRQLLQRAAHGEIPERLNKKINDAVAGKTPNPVGRRVLTIVDDRWDGQEDKSVTIRFNEKNGVNITMALFLDLFGFSFGALYFLYLTSKPGRAGEKERRYFREHIFKSSMAGRG